MKFTTRNIHRIATVTLLSLTLSAFVPMRAADNASVNKKQLKSAIAKAKTPAEHRASADYYRQETQRLTTKANEHELMAAEYIKHPIPYEGKQVYGTVGAGHCRELAKRYSSEAKSAESLAAEHDDMAKAVEGK
jgi:hypothetical protein